MAVPTPGNVGINFAFFKTDDDQRSVFSEHRSQSAVTDSHMTNDLSSRSSFSESVCPVDTTVLENNTFKPGDHLFELNG